MLWRYGRSPVLRALGVIYPLGTTLVVMGTGNHYLLDAVAGAMVLSVSYLLAPRALRVIDRVRARRTGHTTVVATSVVPEEKKEQEEQEQERGAPKAA
jgi:hypothetical protein